MQPFNNKPFFTVLLLFIGSAVLAQTYNADGPSISPSSIQNQAAQLNFSSSQANLANNRTSVSANNAIFIQQVGNENNVASNTFSLESNINLFQLGNKNEVVLNVRAGSINENVFQAGFNNKFLDFSVEGARFHNAAVIQQGRNQNLLWFGNNSISENLMIRMKGNNQTILVRSRR